MLHHLIMHRGMIRLRQLVNILYNLQFFEYLAMLNVNDIVVG